MRHFWLQVSPFDRRDEADAKKREFSTANSDHLTVLRAYKVRVMSRGVNDHELDLSAAIYPSQ